MDWGSIFLMALTSPLKSMAPNSASNLTLIPTLTWTLIWDRWVQTLMLKHMLHQNKHLEYLRQSWVPRRDVDSYLSPSYTVLSSCDRPWLHHVLPTSYPLPENVTHISNLKDYTESNSRLRKAKYGFRLFPLCGFLIDPRFVCEALPTILQTPLSARQTAKGPQSRLKSKWSPHCNTNQGKGV